MDSPLAVVARRLAEWPGRVRDVATTPRLSRSAILRRLARYDFTHPCTLQNVVSDMADLLEQGTLHSTHPRYFGLFNPGVRAAGVAADALAALYNPQVGAWWHAPAAAEVERHTLRYFQRRIGFAGPETSGSFTTGGAEANLTGVLAALARAFPVFVTGGLQALDRHPVFYASDQAHDSLAKIASVTGLGRDALRRVASDARQQMDVGALRQAIARDRADGHEPFLVVGTAGTTATGAIDPLPQLAALCATEGLWFHVDAAWGGLAILSDALRGYVAGIELGDSVTLDAHKVLPVPMGAGCSSPGGAHRPRRCFPSIPGMSLIQSRAHATRINTRFSGRGASSGSRSSSRWPSSGRPASRHSSRDRQPWRICCALNSLRLGGASSTTHRFHSSASHAMTCLRPERPQSLVPLRRRGLPGSRSCGSSMACAPSARASRTTRPAPRTFVR